MKKLGRMIERMARLAPPRHRELIRGMIAELDAITDPAEQARFALGAVAAIARLSLSRRVVGHEEPREGASHGDPPMSHLTSKQLLRRHVIPFVVSLAVLTTVLLANDVGRWAEQLSSRGAPEGTILEVLLFAIPHTIALTIPMAVFLAVSWVFTRLGTEGILDSARRERHGVRRLLIPLLGVATVVAAFTLVSNTAVLPRANARMVAVLEGAPQPPTARTMTIAELRGAAEIARSEPGPESIARSAMYEVEIQKKFAISAAVLILALAAAAVAIRFPWGGGTLVLAGGNLAFIVYWLLLIGGEVLADEQLLSPLVAMWTANACFLAAALLLVWRATHAGPTRGSQTPAIAAGAPRKDARPSSDLDPFKSERNGLTGLGAHPSPT